jgi:hypothetical protein
LLLRIALEDPTSRASSSLASTAGTEYNEPIPVNRWWTVAGKVTLRISWNEEVVVNNGGPFEATALFIFPSVAIVASNNLLLDQNMTSSRREALWVI